MMSKKVITPAPEDFCKAIERFKKSVEEATELFNNIVTVVRCKDCKHRPIKPNDYENGFDLEFPDGKCPCQCDDGWYSWYPPDDWFCADGERK